MMNINVSKAGSLSSLVNASSLVSEDGISLTGPVNQSDWRWLCSVAGRLKSIDLGSAAWCDKSASLGADLQGNTCLRSLSLPSGIKQLEPGCFDSCCNLESCRLPSSLLEVGDMAFMNCCSLSKIELPLSLNSIGDYAFWNCRRLPFISLNDRVTSLGTGCFGNCTSLFSVTDTDALAEVPDSCFRNCTSLEVVTFGPFLSGILRRAFEHCIRLDEVTLPSGIGMVGEAAFKGCLALDTLTLPAGLSTIGPRAFEDCHSLQSLTLPLALKSLQAEVLRGCSHLEELTFGSEAGRSLPGRKHALFGVQKIYEEALRHCRMLSQLVLPPTVCWIDSHAFRGCKLLRTLGCRAKRPPMVMPNSFVGIDQASIELQVPSSSVDLYKRAPLWRDFGRICGIDESDVVA